MTASIKYTDYDVQGAIQKFWELKLQNLKLEDEILSLSWFIFQEMCKMSRERPGETLDSLINLFKFSLGSTCN